MTDDKAEKAQDPAGGAPAIDSFVRETARGPDAPTPARADDKSGTTIGPFLLQRRCGQGAMGVVYQGQDLRDDRPVAVKVLAAELLANPQRAHRFNAEATALAALDHPAIVRYVAHGKTPAGEPFLAMEWLAGEDLAQRLRRGRLSVRESAALGLRAAEALGAAHARGIVHRDIKPGNLFLRGGHARQVTILDFGVARIDHTSLSITTTGVLLGTPAYMAPEQAKGEAQIDTRADVFSLGCVLFECLTGEPAFAGTQLVAILARILFEEPPRVRDRRPEVPLALARLLDRMLAKLPVDRPRDGHAVADALRALGELPDEAPDEPRSGDRPTALTDSEQRAMAVILISAPKLQGGKAKTPGGGETADASVDAPLRREAGLYGGHFERLLDGSAVVLLTSTMLATDLAAQAARCALALRHHVSGRSIALALGRGQVTGQLPTGPTIDRAARLVWASSSDDIANEGVPIVLDELAAGLLDARFDVHKRERGIVLCGEREIAEGARTLLGKATPCVGRDFELRTLEQLYHECLDDRMAQAVTVTAAAGAGKSRLAQEFLRHVKERGEPVTVWICRGDSLRAGSAFAMLGQPLRRAAGIKDGEPLSLRRQKLLARVSQRIGEREQRRVAEFLGELIGSPFPEEESLKLKAARRDSKLMNDQMRGAFLDFLAAECAAAPVLFVLEDLHWGDRPTVQFLDRALKDLREMPLFILALARPEARALFPGLWDERRLQDLPLRALTRRAIERLARQVLGESVQKETIERLATLSEGNAFYLEELIRRAAEGRGEGLPETVVAMVQARLGALDNEARRLLRAASIFGEVFWVEGVTALLGGEEHARRVREWLAELIAREVVVKRGESRFPGQEEIAFRHALLREGAYAMLTNEDRALGHRIAGEWLEQRGEQDTLVLAEHFEQGMEPERAAVFYTHAADQATAGHDLEGALMHTERGLSCATSGPTRGALLVCQSLIHFWRADFEAVDRCGTEALTLIEVGGLRWCQCIGQILLVSLQRNQPERFAALAQTFSSVEPAADARSAYVEAGSVLAVTWSCAGVHGAALRILSRMEQVCAGAARTDASSRAWLKYGVAFYGYVLSDDPWSTYLASQEAIARFREAGDRRLIACTRASLGVMQAELFGREVAEATLRDGITVMEQLKETISFAYIAMHLSLLLAEQGPPDRIDEAYTLARDILDKVPGPTIYGGTACCALAHIHLRRSDLSAAEECARKGREILSVTPGMSPPAFVALIEVLLRQQRIAEARAVAEEGLALLQELGGTGYTELRLRLAAAEARHADADVPAAREAIQDAVKELYARADKIADSAARAHFLGEVPAHARIQRLSRLWQAE